MVSQCHNALSVQTCLSLPCILCTEHLPLFVLILHGGFDIDDFPNMLRNILHWKLADKYFIDF